MSEAMGDVRQESVRFREDYNKLAAEIGKMIVGMESIVEGALTCLFAGGHCLLEGVPGLGKTMLVRTLAQALDLAFSRIQFTPDLMPADIIGTNVINEDPATGKRAFQFESGPIFANLLLADEINRATPKTQSALLEAMRSIPHFSFWRPRIRWSRKAPIRCPRPSSTVSFSSAWWIIPAARSFRRYWTAPRAPKSRASSA
ncbi:MAG: ATPase family associated with various cellular activities (AAA) [candidate division BRC1 bacterium ADurb.BinA364]|nr:MAG: ATPase family associated with various cellular activities (AAA) [candidate division BRC1 bacterium ADurb.BinA364]